MDRSSSYRKLSNQSISCFDNLCETLDISCHEFIQALCIEDDDKYVSKQIPKKGGGFRTVYNPHYRLRKIQRRINNRIFSPKSGNALVSWPKFVYGSVPNEYYEDAFYSKDYISCVKQHCLSKSVLKIDIEDFFDNISEDLVTRIFHEFFKFPKSVSSILAKVCCYQGVLVQGALTSSYLASLCFYDKETDVYNKARRKNLNYTRLLDDITVSSKKIDYNYDYIKKIIVDMLYEKEFPVNFSKTVVQRFNSEPLLVHGLRISYKDPRLPIKELSRIRSAVRNVEKIASEPKFRLTYNYRKEFYKCLGRVNKLSRLGHNQHKALIARLMKVYPKPSKKDVKRCKELVRRLNVDFNEKSGDYWYFKRFHLVQDRLNLVKQSYPNLADELRSQLQLIRPNYAEKI